MKKAAVVIILFASAAWFCVLREIGKIPKANALTSTNAFPYRIMGTDSVVYVSLDGSKATATNKLGEAMTVNVKNFKEAMEFGQAWGENNGGNFIWDCRFTGTNAILLIHGQAKARTQAEPKSEAPSDTNDFEARINSIYMNGFFDGAKYVSNTVQSKPPTNELSKGFFASGLAAEFEKRKMIATNSVLKLPDEYKPRTITKEQSREFRRALGIPDELIYDGHGNLIPSEDSPHPTPVIGLDLAYSNWVDSQPTNSPFREVLAEQLTDTESLQRYQATIAAGQTNNWTPAGWALYRYITNHFIGTNQPAK